jgi:hypothetical protein
MIEKMQEYLDREKIIDHSNKLIEFINKQIKKDNNQLLREYYSEFAKADSNNEYTLGAWKFLQWIIETK